MHCTYRMQCTAGGGGGGGGGGGVMLMPFPDGGVPGNGTELTILWVSEEK